MFSTETSFAVPALSPDGKRVALGEEPGVYVVDRHGTHSRLNSAARNTCTDLAGEDIAWAPRGNGLAYDAFLESDAVLQCAHSVAGIYVRPPGTRSTHKLASGNFGCCDSSWAPDGQHLIVNGFTKKEPEVGAVDVATGDSQLLLKGATASTVNPTTGEIAYVATKSLEATGPAAIGIADSSGQHAHTVVTSPNWLTNLTWSPDGKSLAYTTCGRVTPRHPNPPMSLRVVTLGDGRVRTLASSHGPLWSPAWSPDGRSIAYIAGPLWHYLGTTVRLVNLADGKSRVLLRSSAHGPELIRGFVYSALAWLSPTTPQPRLSRNDCFGF
jgi:Tol biopolymer transport system component